MEQDSVVRNIGGNRMTIRVAKRESENKRSRRK